jgi:translation initiation factor 2B subunit (eIF-2B alpha/beta/delta family)
MKKYKKFFKEEEQTDIKKIISDLIETNWSGSNEEQIKAVQLLKGLATSDESSANKFMKELDDFTSTLKKEDF